MQVFAVLDGEGDKVDQVYVVVVVEIGLRDEVGARFRNALVS